MKLKLFFKGKLIEKQEKNELFILQFLIKIR